MMKHIPLILSLLFAKTCFCQAEEDSSFLMINFKAEATIKVDFKNFSDTILFSTTLYSFLPRDENEGSEQKLYGDGTEYVTLKIQIPQKAYLNFSELTADSSCKVTEVQNTKKDIDFTCFLVPFDTLTINLDYAMWDQPNQSVILEGKYAAIANYYQNKASHFPGIDFLYKKAILANTTMDLNSFKHAIDSITNIELNFLKEYRSINELPGWFTDFESSELKYIGYGIKLKKPLMMRYFDDTTTQVPEDYYSFLDDLPLENRNAILSIYYLLVLRDYFLAIWEPDHLKTLPVSDSIPNTTSYFIEYSRSKFDPYISDILLARDLDGNIGRNQVTADQYNSMIKAINDTSIRNYLEWRYENMEILKKGDIAPNFYLKNDNNEYLSLRNYRDSVVYVSFWMTGCKPCIKEFPEENRLVDVFKNVNVKIISICMESGEENWRYLIDKYQLKTVNLYATGNWEKMLKENYDINGFPHYVLIDRENKIVENKCVRPSQGAEQLIWNLLDN
jgi:peroxiredoxin